MFPRPLQGLVVLALDQVKNYRRVVSPTVLAFALDDGWPCERYNTTPDEMRSIYNDLDHFSVDDDLRARAIEQVLHWGRKRSMGQALDASLEALQRDDVEEAGTALAAARAPVTPDERPLRLSQDVRLVLGHLPENAISTGFNCLDRGWSGGIRPGEFGVALAATNVGKTQTLCYFAASAYKADKNVLYYTFELSTKQTMRRIASAVLRRPLTKVPVEEAPDLLEQVKVVRHIERADIEIRTGTKGVADVLLDLDELAQEDRTPDVLVFDSADDLVAVQKYQSEYQRLGEIYMDLRRLCIAADIAIWTSTQATREAIERAKISLRHMGDSFWKARRAHYVLGFSQTQQQRDEAFGPYMHMTILKDSEHGTPGYVQNLRPAFGRGSEGYPGFEEVEKET